MRALKAGKFLEEEEEKHHQAPQRSMSMYARQGSSQQNERLENLRKRMEIENIHGLNNAAIIDESDNESGSGDTPQFADKQTFEKLERNFKMTEFYLGNNDDSLINGGEIG